MSTLIFAYFSVKGMAAKREKAGAGGAAFWKNVSVMEEEGKTYPKSRA